MTTRQREKQLRGGTIMYVNFLEYKKKSEAQHENSFARKSINSSPCAAARKGTQALKSQTSKKGRGHTTVRLPNELGALNLKTNALITSKNTTPVYSLEQS